MKTSRWLFIALGRSLIIGALLLGAVFAQSGNGALEGRVFNSATGEAVANARISVVGAQISALTDAEGAFRISGLSAGSVQIAVSYLGFGGQDVSVSVPAGGVARRDFELRPADASASGQPVVILDKVTVVADRHTSAQAIAVNERRNAPNIKHVVAFDEYGNVGEEGVGEFLRFLPGVAVNNGGSVATFVSLRGFPDENSPIQLEGADVAGARGANRAQHLFDIPMNNISRVEVTKVPTADMPASGLGGSINLITKSGFESKKPRLNYKAYYIFNKEITIDGGPPGPIPALSPTFQQPSFAFSYLHPVNDRLAVTLSGSRTWRLKPMERDEYSDTQAVWNFVDLIQRQSTYYSLADVMETRAGQAGIDWKISPKDTLNASFQRRWSDRIIFRNALTVTYGAGATGDRTFTQGAANGVGMFQQGNASNQGTRGDTSHLTLKYQHKEDNWRLDAFGSRSSSVFDTTDLDHGSFFSINAVLRTVVARGEGIGETDALIPTRYTATRAGVPIDPYDGGNYSILTATSEQGRTENVQTSGRLDLTREFGGPLPFTAKVGTFLHRNDRNFPSGGVRTWNFNPNGLTTDPARLAGQFDVFDEEFNAGAPSVFGKPMRWISLARLYDLSVERPEWFVPVAATNHINAATNDRQLIETVSGAYVRGDLRLLDKRLWLVGGARLEKTKADGVGLLDDPSLQYQRAADGALLRAANGQPILITTDALMRAQLRYVARGTHVVRKYDGLYPSFNATYNFSDALAFRAAYARTIGRPNLNFILPGASLSEPTVGVPFITVNNTGLKPWTADGYDLSFETYYIKGGFGSIGVFRKNITDFFGAVTMAATPELLAAYGLPDDDLYLGYEIRTQENVGDARIDGLEFTYNQSLFFLPSWARGLSVFLNATKLKLHGDRTANFSGFSPANYAMGVSLVRDRFSVKLNGTYQAEARTNLIAVNAANGVPPDTYGYTGKSKRINLEAEYSLSLRFTLFVTINDIRGGLVSVTRRYPPGVPDYVKDIRRQELGATTNIGVKGVF